jgi:hypothetical protein
VQPNNAVDIRTMETSLMVMVPILCGEHLLLVH